MLTDQVLILCCNIPQVLITMFHTGGSTRLVSSGATDLPGTPCPCQFACGSTFPLHMWREHVHPALSGTTTTNTPGSSATDAAKFTPPSVSPPPAHDLSTVPAPPADTAAPDANSHTASFTTTDTTHYPAAPLTASKPTTAAFPNAHVTSIRGHASAAWQWHHCTHR